MARFRLSAQLHLTAPSAANTQSVLKQVNNQLRNGVTIDVKLNTANAQQQLNNLNKTLNKTNSAAASSADSMEEFGKQAARSIRHFGAFTVATTAFISLIGAIRKGVGDAIEFDRQMVRIAQVTQTTVGSLHGLRDEITKVSKSTGVAASVLAEASVTLAQAGISARDVAKAIDTLAKTELAATFGDITDTTEASIAIMRQFGLQADQLEEKLGSVNRVSAAFAVEAEDITAAVSRAGGSFAAAGGNFEEFIALLTSVRQTTRASAESIATGFNTIFARLQRFRTQDSLEKLGVQLRFTTEEAKKLGDAGLEDQFVGPFEAVKRLSEALSQLRGSDPRFAQIVEELGGYRQIRNVIPLIQQFGVSQKALNIALAGGNSLAKDAEIAQQALSVQIAKVREEFTALIRKISENEGFRTMVDLMLKMASAAIKLVDAIEPLLPMLVAFGGFSAGRATGKFFKGFKENVFKFNSGGLVPGSGPNKDTVPATLTKGEYVLRRSAVKKIGVDKLNAMNTGEASIGRVGYAASGPVTKSPLTPDQADLLRRVSTDKDVIKYPIGAKRTAAAVEFMNNLGFKVDTPSKAVNLSTALKKADSVRGQKAFANFLSGKSSADKAKAKAKKKAQRKSYTLTGAEGPLFGGYFLKGGSGTRITETVFNKERDSAEQFNKMVDTVARANPAMAAQIAKVTDIKVPLELDTINKKRGNQIEGGIRKGFTKLVLSTAQRIGQPKLKPFTRNFSRLPLDSIAGAGFEGVIASFEKEPFDAGDSRQTFDFPHGQSFPELFPKARPNVARDAKLTLNRAAVTSGKSSIRAKVAAVLSGRSSQVNLRGKLKGFNNGGNAKDTVPAMLTPGEYVLNKEAVDKIGLANVDKMNKLQHFNAGGPVKKYAKGGTVQAPASPVGEAFNTFALVSVLQTVVSSFGELGTGVQEAVDVFSSVVVQFVALKAVLSNLPLEKMSGNTLSLLEGFKRADSAILKNVSQVNNLGVSFKQAADIFRTARDIGDFKTAGNALATGRGRDVSTRFGRGFAQLGEARAKRGDRVSHFFKDEAEQRRSIRSSRLSGIKDIALGAPQEALKRGRAGLIRANAGSLLGNRAILQGNNPLAKGRAIQRIGGSLRAAGGVGLAGTLAAGAITDLRESNARKRIASGDVRGGGADLESASMQGGLAQGAIGGAAAGFVVGGPIGAAVGAVAGAGLSYATEIKAVNDVLRDLSGGLIDLQTSSEKAASAVSQFEIGKTSGNISQNTKLLGLAQTQQERAGLTDKIKTDFQKNVRLSSSSDEDTAAAAREALSSNAGDLRSAIESSISRGDVKSEEQLLAKFGSNNISQLAGVEGVDFDGLRREFDALIKVQQNARNVQAAYTQAQLEAQRQLLKIRDFNTALNDAADAAQRFSDNVSAFDSGNIDIPDISALVERASKGELTDANARTLDAASQRVSATIPGGAGIVQGAQVEAAAIKNLPQILAEARKASPFGSENLPSAIEEAFRKQLSNGQNGQEVNAFIEQLGGVIEEIAKVENPNSNAAEILEPQNINKFQEAIQGIQKNLPALGNALSTQAQIAASLKQKADRRLEIEQAFIDNVNSSIDARASVEKDLAVLAGGGTDKRSLAQKNSFVDARTNNTLAGTGFNAQSNPRELAAAAINVKNGLAQLETQISSQGFATSGQISQYEKLRNRLGRFEKAIEDTAENTDKYNNTLEELNKLEAERTNRRDKALGFVLGSDEERLSQSKGIGALSKFVSSGFDSTLLQNEKFRENINAGREFLSGTGLKMIDPRTGKELDSEQLDNEILKSQGFGSGVTSMGDIEKQKVSLLKEIATNTQQANQARIDINRANFNANGAPLQRHSGGSVPGIGNTDSVSALLTPGEFVMRKEAVSRIGLTRLSAMNSGKQKFADGGLVQPQGQVINIQGLDASVAKFVQATNVLAQSLSTFPSEITGSFTVKHEHIFVGLEVMARLEPSIKEMTAALIEQKLQRFVDDKFPDLGRANAY